MKNKFAHFIAAFIFAAEILKKQNSHKMKKVLALLAVAGFVACSNGENKDAKVDSPAAPKVDSPATPKVDSPAMKVDSPAVKVDSPAAAKPAEKH